MTRVVLVADEPLRGWAARAASLVAADPLVDEATVLTVPSPRPRAGLGLRAYAALDRVTVARRARALHPVDDRDAAPASLERTAPDRLDARLAELAPELVIHLGSRPARPLADAEVWQLRHGALPAGSAQAALPELAFGGHVCVSRLVRVDPNGETTLYASRSALRRLSLGLSLEPIAWKAATFPARALELRRRGAAQPRGELPVAELAEPRPTGLARLLAGRALSHVRDRVFRRLTWSIVWQERSNPATGTAEFRPGGALVPSPGRFFADPFLVDGEDGRWLFYEDYRRDLRRAAIAATELNGSLPAPGPVVLEAPHHLSYPFVFRAEGEHFMVPESAAADAVTLLRARRFPYEWEPEATLLAGIRAYDPTLHRHEGRWYLFAAVAAEGADPPDELHVFWSEELRGPYRAHPLNPVVSDVCSARPAGRILRDGDRLLRPGQDCSGGYGSALVLSELLRLTPSEYAEAPAGRIEPAWDSAARGTHTIDHDGGLQVMDLKRLDSRFPRRSARAGAT
jgi:hypothetical protein